MGYAFLTTYQSYYLMVHDGRLVALAPHFAGRTSIGEVIRMAVVEPYSLMTGTPSSIWLVSGGLRRQYRRRCQ